MTSSKEKPLAAANGEGARDTELKSMIAQPVAESKRDAILKELLSQIQKFIDVARARPLRAVEACQSRVMPYARHYDVLLRCAQRPAEYDK